MFLRNLIFVVAILCDMQSDAQDVRTYLGTIDPHISSGIPYYHRGDIIIQVAGNVLVLVSGHVDVLDAHQRVMYLIKVDLSDFSTAEALKTTGPQGDMAFIAGILHSDGHLYFTGEWADYTIGRMRMFLAKYTKDLEPVWLRLFEEMNDPDYGYFAYDLCEAHDRDVMIVYSTRNYEATGRRQDTRMLKTDTAGVVQFNKILQDTLWASIGRGNISPTDDGHYVVTTYSSYLHVNSPQQVIIHKIDEDAEIVWTTIRVGLLRGANLQSPRSASLPGGGVAVAWIQDTLVWTVDESLFWYHTLDTYDDEGLPQSRYGWKVDVNATIEDLHTATNGDILGCGYWRPWGGIGIPAPWLRGWVFRFSPEGELKWERHYNDSINRPWAVSEDPIYFNRMTELDDGRIAITGYGMDTTDYPGSSTGLNANVLLVVLDSMGCLVPGCEGVNQVLSTKDVHHIGRIPLAQLIVAPNPASASALLRWPGDPPAGMYDFQILAYDASGRPFWSGPWDGREPKHLDTGAWPVGQVYLVLLHRGVPAATAKLVIVKH